MSFEFRPMRSLIFVDCVREEYRHRLQHWLYNTHLQVYPLLCEVRLL